MVQIIDEFREPSTSERFSQAFAGLGDYLGQAIPQHLIGKSQQKAIANLLGEEYANLPREFQQKAFEYALDVRNKQALQSQKLQGSSIQDEDAYNIIKDQFGEKAANLFKASPVGAKTEIIKNLIERESREEFGEILNKKRQEAGIPIEGEQPQENIIRTKLMDFDKGLTPKERTARQNARYSINLPLFQESVQKFKAAEADRDNLNILKELSPQISGMQRLNINPVSGDLFIPGLGSPEAQRYVKTVNDFTRNAKDSYGSRVTNFDLLQFMKRLPTLANSEEGREQIIEQLQIINDINMAKAKELQDVFDEYGGIRNVDFDKAESIADKRASKTVEKLRKEFKEIGRDLDKQERKIIQDRKKITRPGYVSVRFNDGRLAEIPKESLKEFLQDGAGEEL